jgi:hypothetical protein
MPLMEKSITGNSNFLHTAMCLSLFSNEIYNPEIMMGVDDHPKRWNYFQYLQISITDQRITFQKPFIAAILGTIKVAER